jgi:hypothetical protein
MSAENSASIQLIDVRAVDLPTADEMTRRDQPTPALQHHRLKPRPAIVRRRGGRKEQAAWLTVATGTGHTARATAVRTGKGRDDCTFNVMGNSCRYSR